MTSAPKKIISQTERAAKSTIQGNLRLPKKALSEAKRGVSLFTPGAPKIPGQPDPIAIDPAPTPIAGREEDEAKKKAKRRVSRTGRASQIFAGRLNAQSGGNQILKTRLG